MELMCDRINKKIFVERRIRFIERNQDWYDLFL